LKAALFLSLEKGFLTLETLPGLKSDTFRRKGFVNVGNEPILFPKLEISFSRKKLRGLGNCVSGIGNA